MVAGGRHEVSASGDGQHTVLLDPYEQERRPSPGK